MKNTITKAFIVLLLAITGVAKAQTFEFAPLGTEWFYETQSMFSSGYIRMEAVKDTVVDGQDCIKLAREEYWHDHQLGGLHGGPRSPLFIAQKDDSVMVYQNGIFLKLFDFGAETGDTWVVPGQEGVCPENYGTVVVIDKGIETINGNPLRYVTVKDLPDSYWGFGNAMHGSLSEAVKIVERIGPIGSYFLPEQRCQFDYAEGGPLRCYIDDELGELHYSTLYPDRNCDYISDTYQSVDESESSYGLKLFPNPTTDKLTINIEPAVEPETSSPVHIELTGADGRVIMQTTALGNNVTLDMDDLSPGIYVLSVKGNAFLHRQTIIKTE